MKKLMFAALVACSLCAFAEDAAAPKPADDAKPAKVERQKMSPAERKAFHEKMMAARMARKAENQKKTIDVLKEAGLTDEQSKSVAEKIEQIYMPNRGPRAGKRKAPAAK